MFDAVPTHVFVVAFAVYHIAIAVFTRFHGFWVFCFFRCLCVAVVDVCVVDFVIVFVFGAVGSLSLSLAVTQGPRCPYAPALQAAPGHGKGRDGSGRGREARYGPGSPPTRVVLATSPYLFSSGGFAIVASQLWFRKYGFCRFGLLANVVLQVWYLHL